MDKHQEVVDAYADGWNEGHGIRRAEDSERLSAYEAREARLRALCKFYIIDQCGQQSIDVRSILDVLDGK